jgi:ABC-type glutathione transport system ATPase component
MSLLGVEGLTVGYGPHEVLSGVDLEVAEGELVGIIGETGSGKSTLARAVTGLVRPRSGRVRFEDVELSALGRRALRDFRRSGRLQLVFQDPLRALDPDLPVNRLVGEPLAIAGVPHPRIADALADVGLDPGLADRRPGELSGGQRQRVLLARALVTRPRLLICDEPVSALDAATRRHVLRLLAGLRDGRAIVVISHDLYSLAGIADRVAVLHQGRIVEHGPTSQILERPAHEYTARLVAAAPRLRRERLAVLEVES